MRRRLRHLSFRSTRRARGERGAHPPRLQRLDIRPLSAAVVRHALHEPHLGAVHGRCTFCRPPPREGKRRCLAAAADAALYIAVPANGRARRGAARSLRASFAFACACPCPCCTAAATRHEPFFVGFARFARGRRPHRRAARLVPGAVAQRRRDPEHRARFFGVAFPSSSASLKRAPLRHQQPQERRRRGHPRAGLPTRRPAAVASATRRCGGARAPGFVTAAGSVVEDGREHRVDRRDERVGRERVGVGEERLLRSFASPRRIVACICRCAREGESNGVRWRRAHPRAIVGAARTRRRAPSRTATRSRGRARPRPTRARGVVVAAVTAVWPWGRRRAWGSRRPPGKMEGAVAGRLRSGFTEAARVERRPIARPGRRRPRREAVRDLCENVARLAMDNP